MVFRLNGRTVQGGGPDDRLLSWDRVQDMTGISRSTAWRMTEAGDFPSRVAASPGRVGWWESELAAWKASRSAAGAAPAPTRTQDPGRTGKPRLGAATPRLPGMARRAPVRPPDPPKPPVTAAAPVSPEPRQAVEQAGPPARRRRARPVHADQIDFGF